MMRDGFEMDSRQAGVLDVGEVIQLAERRPNEASIFRCKFVTSTGVIAWCASTHPAPSQLARLYPHRAIAEMKPFALIAAD